MVPRQASVSAKCEPQLKESILETGSHLLPGVKAASLSPLLRRKVSLALHIRPLIKGVCLPRVANPKVHLVSLACLTWVVKALLIIRTSQRAPTLVPRDLASSPAFRPLELRYWQRCNPHPRMKIKTVSSTSKVKSRCLRSPLTRLASPRSRMFRT